MGKLASIRFALHRTLRAPYRLSTYTYGSPDKPVVVLLHGLNNSSESWLPVITQLKKEAYIVSIDLLGFGNSPKPDDIDYTAEEHLRSLHYTIKKQNLQTPYVLVGHSMGSILACYYANSHQHDVKRLVLCSLPYYRNREIDGRMSARWAQRADKTLLYIYQWLRAHPGVTIKSAQIAKRVNRKEISFDLTKEKWFPFQQSLQHTIEAQDLTKPLKSIKVPIDIVYGRLDPLLNLPSLRALAKQHKHVKLYPVGSAHDLTKTLSKSLAIVIDDAL